MESLWVLGNEIALYDAEISIFLVKLGAGPLTKSDENE